MTDAVAVMLVGGRGSRLGAIAWPTPKPLLPIGGRPFIEWPMLMLARAGVRRFVLSAGYQAQAIADFAHERRRNGAQIEVVTEVSPQGTGGAIVAAAASVGGVDPIVVSNGDSVLVADLSSIWVALTADDDGLLVATYTNSPKRFGSVRTTSDGYLSALNEKSGVGRLVNAGIYLLRRRLIAAAPSIRPLSFEADFVPTLLEQGRRIRVLPFRAPFIDIGVPESLARADEFVRTHIGEEATL